MQFCMLKGQLYFVASNHNSSQDAIFQIDSFGKMEPILIRDDLKWISDLSVLNNGVVLIRYKSQSNAYSYSPDRSGDNLMKKIIL